MARNAQPLRVLLVTFDLTHTVPGDRRYKVADNAMRTHGPIFRPIKQTRFLITASHPSAVLASLRQQLGSVSIMILRLRSMGQLQLHRARKKEMGHLAGEIRRARIEFDGIDDF